jgi:hypothetical protein
MLKRHAGIALAASVAILTACGDSTAPHPVTPAQLARHLDSLSRAADTTEGSGGRYIFLSQAEVAPANGASPVPVTVRTKSGAQTWQGFVMKFADTLAFTTGYDSIYILFAYRDYAMNTYLVAQTTYFHGDGALAQIWVISDTSFASAGGQYGSGTNTFAMSALSSPCSLISGLKNYDWPDDGCNLATFTAGVLWNLPNVGGETADFATVTIAPQAYDGIFMH